MSKEYSAEGMQQHKAVLAEKYKKRKAYMYSVGSYFNARAFAEDLGLIENDTLSGYTRCTISISYSWTTFEGADFTLMSYIDNNYAHEIAIYANDNATLEKVRDMLVEEGVVQSKEERKAARDANAKMRLHTVAVKGFAEGTRVTLAGAAGVIESISKAGICKVKFDGAEVAENCKPARLKVAK
jgi:hypothetical protein